MAIIKIPPSLQSYTDRERILSISGRTIREVLTNLMLLYPSLKKQIVDNDNNFRSFLSIYLEGENIKNLNNGIDTPIKEEAKILFIASMAGG